MKTRGVYEELRWIQGGLTVKAFQTLKERVAENWASRVTYHLVLPFLLLHITSLLHEQHSTATIASTRGNCEDRAYKARIAAHGPGLREGGERLVLADLLTGRE